MTAKTNTERAREYRLRTKKTLLQVYLEPEVYADLKEMAGRENLTLSNAVTKALAQHFKLFGYWNLKE